MGTMAMRKQMPNIRFTQWRRRVCSQAMTPVMPNRGSHAPSEAHLEPESGVKLGRAGISGGKKKHSRCGGTAGCGHKEGRSNRWEDCPPGDSARRSVPTAPTAHRPFPRPAPLPEPAAESPGGLFASCPQTYAQTSRSCRRLPVLRKSNS